MKRFLLSTALGTLVLGVTPLTQGFDVLSLDDFIIAIDVDDGTTGSASPGAEGAANILDGDPNTKYLNFGITNTGFIVTPTASSMVHSFTLTTANDAVPRDPASWELYGTNDSITSLDHSAGTDENWTLIGSGDVALPDDRLTLGPVVSFSNSTSYSSYRMIFPTVKDEANANSMQIADVGFFASSDGTGPNILTGASLIRPIRLAELMPQSDYPAAEPPAAAIDQNVNTKYLNFGVENSGFIVTPAAGATAVNGFQITTANDFEVRDPASWELYGTNDPIESEDNSRGDGENWTLVDSGTLTLPVDRFTPGDVVAVNNTTTYSSYRMVFPTLKDAATANSMQIAEVQFFAPGVDARLEVDRSTGEVRIVADENATFGSYQIQSLTSGSLDDSAWTSISDTGADPDDDWTIVSDPGDPFNLEEEDAAGGADNGMTITAGNSLSLGNIWRQTPLGEDLVFRLRDENGNLIATEVSYVGTEIALGDYNGDGVVSAADWPAFRAGLGGDYTGMSPAQAYLGGDLDGDFDSDLDDFNLFVNAAGGLAALFGEGATVPEPSSLALLGVMGALTLGFRLRRRCGAVSAVAIVYGLAATVAVNSAEAQVFTNLGSPATVTTPDPLSTPESGPVNLFDDTFLDNSPSEFDAQLFNADYTSEFLMDLLQYAGLGPEPKTVFMDFGSSITTNWFAYAQRSGADPTADRVGMFEFWFSDSDFGGVLPGSDPDAVFELDPGDARVQDSILRPYPLFGEHSGRYAAMRLTVSDLSANQPTNNIGGHEFRFMSGPSDVVLEVDRETGAMVMRNNGAMAQAIDIKAYEIHSDAGALLASGFNGIGGDSGAFPVGNGTGNGWEIAGGNDDFSLLEAYFSGASSLAAGVASLPLGTAYDVSSHSQDLMFRYTNSQGHVYDGRVEYVGVAPALAGDYNNDGKVDAADYTAWRDNVGAPAGTLPNDVDGGVIGTDQYDTWVANFGAGGSGAGSGSTAAVPEPSALGLLLLGWGIAGAIGVCRRLR